jgi:tetratricopeptide (TPR) repeat protein
MFVKATDQLSLRSNSVLPQTPISMTFGPVPLVDFNNFLDDITAYLSNDVGPTEFQVKQLRAKAANIKKTSMAELGAVAESSIEALLWNSNRVLEIAENGLRVYGESVLLLANFAVSCRHVNLLEEAMAYTRRAHDIDPHDVAVLRSLVEYCFGTGRLSDAAQILSTFLFRSGENSDFREDAKGLFELAKAQLNALQLANVSEERFQRELTTALKVLRDCKVRAQLTSLREVADPDGDRAIEAAFMFRGDIAQELRLGAILANELGELEEWDPNTLSVSFVYSEPAHALVSS